MKPVKELEKKELNETAIDKKGKDELLTPPPMFVEFEKMFDRMAEITRQTASRAFDFFRQRGGEWGRELDDWFKAENELLRPVPIEMKEVDNNIILRAAVPGFKPEEIEVSVKDNNLIISGQTEISEKKDEENLILNEWKSNRFFRQLTLPSPVDPDAVKAVLKDGLLELTLPKIEASPAKNIEVSAG